MLVSCMTTDQATQHYAFSKHKSTFFSLLFLISLISHWSVLIEDDTPLVHNHVVVCWLLNVLTTCKCISGTDLLRQFYMLPHRDQ